MSRSKLIRALLAAASLLGAVPLMGQATTVASAGSSFPYGTYDSPLPADDNHEQPRTLRVELAPGWMKVFEEGNLIQAYALSVSGRNLQLSRLSGPCTDPQPIVGSYTWSMDHDVLSFAVVSDACPGRSEKLARTHLIRTSPSAATATRPAMPPTATANGFPMGRYTLQGIDSAHQAPAGLIIEFTPTVVNVINGGQVVETHQMTVDGAKWEVFEIGGSCTEPGDYLWHVDGTTLWMQLVNDPCEDRARSITTVKFVRE